MLHSAVHGVNLTATIALLLIRLSLYSGKCRRYGFRCPPLHVVIPILRTEVALDHWIISDVHHIKTQIELMYYAECRVLVRYALLDHALVLMQELANLAGATVTEIATLSGLFFGVDKV